MLKRIHLTCGIARASLTITTTVGVGGQTYRSRQKHKPLSLQDLSIGRHWLGISFRTSLDSNLGTSLNTNNTTGNNCIISNAQNTTACFKWNTSVTGHKTGDDRLSPAQRTAKVNCRFRSHYQYITALLAKQYYNCQGQLQIPSSLPVHNRSVRTTVLQLPSAWFFHYIVML